MKRVRTCDLKPGMMTAEDVYSYNNQMILPKDTILTDKMITRLEFYSVLAIRVTGSPDDSEDEIVNEIDEVKNEVIPEISENSSYSQKIRASKQFKEFEKSYIENANNFRSELFSIAKGNTKLDAKHILRNIDSLIDDTMTTYSLFDMLHNMRQYDDMTYMHCMNVSLICNISARWLGYAKEDIEKLTLCGLLHDIGKIMVPENIMNKPDKLTPAEYNIVKTHTLQGYKILKDLDIDNDIKECALMHHERCDGSGYPLGLPSDRINPYAKIVAIADVYDAMTAARLYRGPLCPFRVIGIFESEGLQKYDSKYILTFLEHIGETYLNNRVRLNNGVEGTVVFINKNSIAKPMIQCGSEFVDLSKENDLYIETFV